MKNLRTCVALAALALPAAAQDAVDPRKAEVLRKLNSLRLTVDFQSTRLEDAIGFLREAAGVDFHVDPDVFTKLDEERLKVTLRVKDLLLKSILKLMLSARDLTAVYRDGVIVVQHRDKAGSKAALAVYDVRDLLVKLQDFPGPRVELASSSGGAAITGAMFVLEEPKASITEDFLTELVKGNTGDTSWDDNPDASISLANGLLVVTQTRKVHAEVKRLLDLLRQFK